MHPDLGRLVDEEREALRRASEAPEQRRAARRARGRARFPARRRDSPRRGDPSVRARVGPAAGRERRTRSGRRLPRAAARNARSVFSGASAAAPRWPIRNGPCSRRVEVDHRRLGGVERVGSSRVDAHDGSDSPRASEPNVRPIRISFRQRPKRRWISCQIVTSRATLATRRTSSTSQNRIPARRVRLRCSIRALRRARWSRTGPGPLRGRRQGRRRGSPHASAVPRIGSVRARLRLRDAPYCAPDGVS